jgi:hypothetical protein
MMRRLALRLALLPGLVQAGAARQPAQMPVPPTPYEMCEAAIDSAEARQPLPARVLHSIALRESGRYDPQTGRIRPWPWTIDFEGAGRTYPTKDEAIAAVQAIQAAGGASIDIGCMQVNLVQHPDAFASLEEAFDPARNAAYAGRFLGSLFASLGDWGAAIGAYHSRTPGVGEPYRDRVVAAWNPTDPTVLARLTLPPPQVGLFPMTVFPMSIQGTSAAWQSATTGSILPAAGIGQSRMGQSGMSQSGVGQGGMRRTGGAYQSFRPATIVYADFATKSGRSLGRIPPIDLRLGSGLTDTGRGLVVPKGVIFRTIVAPPKSSMSKPSALDRTARRPGATG